ncbi:hypothetical protein [Maricaulis sp. CAU 1757]
MEHEGVLIGIAQLGAVFAGFLALVVVFVSGGDRADPVSGLHGRSVLYSSFLTIFGALFPLALFAAGVREDLAWRLPAGAVLPVALAMLAESLRFYLKMDADQRRAFGYLVPFASWGLSGVGMTLAVLVAAAVLDGPVFILAMVLALAAVTVNFMALALQRWL